jgi:phenylacetate-CoA ligase
MAAINMHSRIFDALRQFQFLQEKPGCVVFRYVAKHPPISPEAESRIRHGLQIKLGEDVELLLQPVTEISLTPNGKLRFLEQRLPVRYGDR